MLMQNPNKGRVTTIIASIKKQKGMKSDDGAGEEYREQKGPATDNERAKEAAMEGFMGAVDKKDPRGMVRALQTFFDLCSGDSEGGEEESKENSYDDGY